MPLNLRLRTDHNYQRSVLPKKQVQAPEVVDPALERRHRDALHQISAHGESIAHDPCADILAIDVVATGYDHHNLPLPERRRRLHHNASNAPATGHQPLRLEFRERAHHDADRNAEMRSKLPHLRQPVARLVLA